MREMAMSSALRICAGVLAISALVALPIGGTTSNALAQDHTTSEGTRLITLGTAGGPLPQKERTQSSNLLIVRGHLYLIDAGDDVTRRIVQAGQDFRQVDKVFITHAHSDHTMGLATLLVSEWEYQRRTPIDVYGAVGTEALVRGAIQYLTPNADIRWSEGKRTPMASIFHGHDAQPGVVFQDENVKVRAAENTHFHFTPNSPGYGKYKSFSYRFETPGRVVVFSGDTGPSDVLTELAKGADVLVTEVGMPEEVVDLYKKNGTWDKRPPEEREAFLRHMREEHVTPEDVGKIATKAGVKMVVLTHLLPTANADDDYARYAEATKKYFSGRVVVAKDLMEF
jgi:ribonuclease BN (tRNA processing enzyme)